MVVSLLPFRVTRFLGRPPLMRVSSIPGTVHLSGRPVTPLPLFRGQHFVAGACNCLGQTPSRFVMFPCKVAGAPIPALFPLRMSSADAVSRRRWQRNPRPIPDFQICRRPAFSRSPARKCHEPREGNGTIITRQPLAPPRETTGPARKSRAWCPPGCNNQQSVSFRHYFEAAQARRFV